MGKAEVVKFMSTHKTTVDQEIVQNFLKEKFPTGVSDFEMIIGGESSQAYSFSADGKNYIIRLNKHNTRGFKKDEYAFNHYGSNLIPIPKVYEIGKTNDSLNYCISEKVPGKLLHEFRGEEFKNMLPDMFRVLDAIHACDISNTSGYGKWNEDGQGEYKTWKEMLLSVGKHLEENGKSLFETSFLEKDFWDMAYAKLTELVQYCSEERFLVHGDYGFNNELAEGAKITGVIDWDCSMYGDFLYDVAWLGFWSPVPDYKKFYLEHSKVEIKDFEKRVLCYMVFIGLNSISFYAYSGQEEKYGWAKERVNSLIK